MNKHPFDTYHQSWAPRPLLVSPRALTAPPPLLASWGRAGALFLCSIIDPLLPLMGYAAAAAAAAQLAGHHAVLKPLDDPVDLSPVSK